MRFRLVLTSSLAATIALVGSPAFAAKTLCNLVVDDQKNDGYAQTGGAVLRTPALDIHGGDVATGKKTLVVVMRLQKADTTNDPVASLGLTWTFTFTARGSTYTFQRRRAIGTTPAFSYSGPGGDALKVKETNTKNDLEVRFTTPRSAVPELKKPRTVLERLSMSSSVFVTNGDFAGSTKVYPDKAPSCLKPA